MSDLPTPKFSIGQTVYRYYIETATEKFPCPDCLGTLKWQVTTPGGSVLEVRCQRCGDYTPRDMPSLKRHTFSPRVTKLTVGSIKIDTHPWNGGDLVEYMCTETGLGSGSTYRESMLAATEDEAARLADAEARSKVAEIDAEPKRVEQKALADLTITDALFEVCHSAIWNSWYRYRCLADNIRQFLDEEGTTESEKIEAIEDEIRFDENYRVDRHMFDDLLSAARSGDADKLTAALAKFPEKPKVPKPEPLFA